MLIQISGTRLAESEDVVRTLEDGVQRVAESLGSRVERVLLHLSESSARPGGQAVACRLDARLRGGEVLHTSAQGPDPLAAARRSIQRLHKLLRRRSRRRVAVRRPSAPLVGATWGVS